MQLAVHALSDGAWTMQRHTAEIMVTHRSDPDCWPRAVADFERPRAVPLMEAGRDTTVGA